ncbi:type VI secretion system tip protein VgrG [Motilimonas sp. E26]|uniref:type VI secretion system Vgr family protein n=1 Tax=Motilimonas sp. E26 TaxID=2865674 RepID=UPI001E2D9941|nr:type VI secretion system tip protein VgrG [Motilimonas sp. E26]MCE0559231.1 type VI secretion system tip protein VgrG [Motilimonas sp. E26]
MANGTGLQFTLQINSLTRGEFVVLQFDYDEALSSIYQVQLDLASRREDIIPQEVVDQTALLTVYQDGVVLRYVHGIVSAFEQGDMGHHHTFYRLTIEPSAARLALRHNSRIFQQLNALDIISILLQEMGIEDYAFACQRTPAVREYCVQYRETDLTFIARLAAEEGLFYFFEQHPDKHTLVFADDVQALIPHTAPYEYNANAGGVKKQFFVSQLAHQSSVAPSAVQLKDYSFKTPNNALLSNQAGQAQSWQRQDYEHYDYPGRYKEAGSGSAFVRYRMESLRAEAEAISGSSNIPMWLSGSRFSLIEHLNGAMNRDWNIVSVRHHGEQPQALEEAGTSGQTRYVNHFRATPSHLQWRPEPNPKPRVDGPQIATVTGPQGEEIFCDEHGRVKVQFPWDRYSNNDENASCWIRVSQDWAGAQYGNMAIPRIGHEVIVSFLEGDPDQPIITGRTYHATNRPPYALPEHKTRTVLRTETHKGDGYNELRFEDEVGQEEIYIHAQKDQNRQIENDWGEQIKRDQHSEVDRDRFSLIKGNQHLTTHGETRDLIKGDQTWLMDSKLHTKVGQKWLTEVSDEVHQQAGNKVVLDAGVEITLSAGGSFIKLDPAGVHLVGPAINMNSGGSAGSGSGYAGQVAELVKGVEQAVEIAPLEIIQTPALKLAEYAPFEVTRQIAALRSGEPLVSICNPPEEEDVQ